MLPCQTGSVAVLLFPVTSEVIHHTSPHRSRLSGYPEIILGAANMLVCGNSNDRDRSFASNEDPTPGAQIDIASSKG